VTDFIDRLLEVEKQARQIIARADRDAAAAVAEGRAEAKRIVAEAREQARREAEELIAGEARELAERRQKLIDKERAKLPRLAGQDQKKLAEAVDMVVRAVADGDLPPD